MFGRAFAIVCEHVNQFENEEKVMKSRMNTHICDICMNANIRINGFDFLLWRQELGWEQWKGQDLETAARLDDPR